MDPKAALRSRCSIASVSSWISFSRTSDFRQRFFRRVNAGMPGGLRLGGIDEEFFIEFFAGTETGEL